MKRIAILSLVTLGMSMAQAQTNPQEGYIITHENDTVRGIIDYRTDAKNARSCLFKAGQNAQGAADNGGFREYLPQDINGYGVVENGALYVTRTFTVEGEQKTLFAELLLQGDISLYRHRESGTDYFYLTDQTGKTACIRETGIVHQKREEQMAAQRRKVAEASQMFQRSQKTLQQLWTMPTITADGLLRLTKDYNREFGASASEGTTFLKGSHSPNKIEAKLRIEAGVGFNKMTLWPYNEANPALNINTVSPVVGIGADVIIPRFSRHLFAQVMLLYSYNSGEAGPAANDYYKAQREVSFHDVALHFGPALRLLPDSRLSPVVRAGVALDYLLGMKTTNMRQQYHDSEHIQENKTISARYYAGAGIDYDCNGHKLSLMGNYVMRNFGTFGLRSPMVTVSLGYTF